MGDLGEGLHIRGMRPHQQSHALASKKLRIFSDEVRDTHGLVRVFRGRDVGPSEPLGLRGAERRGPHDAPLQRFLDPGLLPHEDRVPGVTTRPHLLAVALVLGDPLRLPEPGRDEHHVVRAATRPAKRQQMLFRGPLRPGAVPQVDDGLARHRSRRPVKAVREEDRLGRQVVPQAEQRPSRAHLQSLGVVQPLPLEEERIRTIQPRHPGGRLVEEYPHPFDGIRLDARKPMDDDDGPGWQQPARQAQELNDDTAHSEDDLSCRGPRSQAWPPCRG